MLRFVLDWRPVDWRCAVAAPALLLAACGGGEDASKSQGDAAATPSLAEAAAHAEATRPQTPWTREDGAQAIWATAETPEGGVGWDLLGTTQERVTEDGVIPEFSEAVEALDGRTVRIAGYIYPLDTSPRQKEFLFTALPPSCPYCIEAGPTQYMEVVSDDGVRFSYNALTLEGSLELVRDDPAGGTFYRLTGAREAG